MKMRNKRGLQEKQVLPWGSSRNGEVHCPSNYKAKVGTNQDFNEQPGCVSFCIMH